LKPWRRLAKTTLERCGIFDLQRWRFQPADGRPPQEFTVLDAPHWINVIPLTAEREVLLVRQYRYGTEEFTLEIPGGMCDGDEEPIVAARRELLEETGHDAGEWTELGWVHPNPAIQNNRCYTYLAERVVRVGEPQPDRNEAFEQLRVPLSEIPALIDRRRITHALVVAAFQLLSARS
jgi:8-oxo-dGTP pyrophosphatase MutT (NUDIX family)